MIAALKAHTPWRMGSVRCERGVISVRRRAAVPPDDRCALRIKPCLPPSPPFPKLTSSHGHDSIILHHSDMLPAMFPKVAQPVLGLVCGRMPFLAFGFRVLR